MNAKCECNEFYRVEVRLLKVQPQEGGETFLSEQKYYSIDALDHDFAQAAFSSCFEQLENANETDLTVIDVSGIEVVRNGSKYDVIVNDEVRHPNCTAEDVMRALATYLAGRNDPTRLPSP